MAISAFSSGGSRAVPPLVRGVAGRTVLALATIGLAGASVSGALAAILRDSNPELAHRVAPLDAGASQALAAAIVVTSDKRTDIAQAKRLTQSALRGGELSAAALRTAGFVAEREGDVPRATRLITLAERLSRRDLLTQLWLIEHYSASGDVSRTLEHYETALTTSASALQLLYPVLIGASSDPQLTPSITAFLARNRSREWWKRMVYAFIGDSTDPKALAAVVNGSLKPRSADEAELARAAIARLVAFKAYDEALSVYRSFTGNAADAARGVANGDFESDPAWPPFDWALSDEADYRAYRGPAPEGRGGNVLWLQVGNGNNGDLATQMLNLPAGAYVLGATSGGGDTNINRLDLRVLCLGENDRLLASMAMPANGAGKRLAGRFVVPAGCRWQRLLVTAHGEGMEDSAATWIDQVSIRPAAN